MVLTSTSGEQAQNDCLQVVRVSKSFRSFLALRDVSFGVRRGEFVVFLGPSGCGKTTLLRIIAGLEVQSAGEVRHNGREISPLPPSKRGFGIVFQSYALFPNLTIYDNVAYGLKSRRMKPGLIRERVTELLHLIGLPGQGGQYPAQLSGGEQQRVALARALATSPSLLLLDEPLSALDARVRIRMRAELKKLQRGFDLTTIMVTHDQAEALTLADRIVVMNHGSIEQIGAPADIYQKPASPFVADFIGTMNFIPVEIVGHDSIQAGGMKLRCELPNGQHAGAATLAIRAEDLRLSSAPVQGNNALSGYIEEVEYSGSFCRALVRIDELDGRTLIADVPTRSVRDEKIATGSQVLVHLPEEFIRVFPN